MAVSHASMVGTMTLSYTLEPLSITKALSCAPYNHNDYEGLIMCQYNHIDRDGLD